ncbi:VP5 [Mobuck virus]|uniref:VP5 n=1 Tax=Mobuck virus TaxID=1408137 RepID=UPI0003BA1252|nr:VP5 [Mobuck virus]AGX89724.1 VP5 [Mobuck virus]AYA60492.1 VP5 [Mobuck virus]
MGKFSSALARFGRGIKNVATSDTMKRIASTAGTAIMKAAESEVGQKVIAGVVQGVAEAAITDVEVGGAIKKAIIGNVVGVHELPVDPLNPTEQELNNKLRNLQREIKSTQALEQINQEAEAKLANNIEKLREVLLKESKITRSEQNQVEALDISMRSMIELTEHEARGLQELQDALIKEARARTRDETKMVEALKANYLSMSNVVKTEREALIEEAMEQTIDIGGEIAEHLAAEVPFIGEGIATGMATARGTMQIYKLATIISKLTGVDVRHAELPAISPIAIDTLLTTDNINEGALQKIVLAKIKQVEDVHKELVHLNEVVNEEIQRKSADESLKTGSADTTIHHTLRSNYHIPRNKRPGIHVFTAPYDSDYVLMFLINSPYSQHRACLVCFDLLIDYVMMQDISHGGTKLHKGPKGGNLVNFKAAYKEFFRESARNAGSSTMHSERMSRSAGNEPLYVTSLHYPYSYTHTRKNAEIICRNQDVQKHLLRGPLAMQRKAILNAIQHGVTIVTGSRSRSVQQGAKILK